MTIPTPRATAAPTADPVAVGIGYGWGDLDCKLTAALTAATELAIAHLNAQGGLCGRTLQAQLEPGRDCATIFGWSQSHGPNTTALGKTLLWEPLTPAQFTPNPQVFYTGPCLNQTVQLVVDWYRQQPPQRVFLLGSPAEKSQQLRELLSRDLAALGIEIVGEMEIKQNYNRLMAAVTETAADRLIDTRILGQAALLAAITQAGHTATTFPILFLHLTREDYPLAAGHLLATHYNPEGSTPENQAFRRDWPLEIAPGTAAATAYTQVFLWAQAVALAQSFDPDAVRTAAYGQSFTGPQGLLQIHPNHHLSWGGAIARCTATGELETLWQATQPISPLPGQHLANEATENSPLLTQITQERLHRQRLQDTLRDYGLELRTLFTALTETVLITDIYGCILRILPTRGPLHINGDRIGQGIITIFPVEILPHLHEHLQAACRNQSRQQYEYQETEGGRWFAIDFAPIVDREQVIWVIRDITEQKLMELERRASLDELRQQFAERTKALIAANDQLVGEIVERQQAETALQAVLDAVPGIVSWISADLRYLGVNRHLAAMFGLEPQEFVGKGIGFLNASDEFMGFVRDFFESDRTEDFQEIVAQVEGRQRHYLIVMQKYDQGRGAFSVGIDITERIEAESGLARSKEQLQAVLEAVPGIVSWISADLHYMGVNRHLARTFGLAPADFVGQPIGFLQASSDFNTFVREFFASPAQDDFREVEAIVEGETRNYLIAAQKYDNGQAAFTVGIDVTERQRAIEDLARSKDQLQAVLEAVPGIVSWIGADLRYMGVNRQLARTFNREPEEFVGQDIGFLQASSDFNTFVKEFFASPAQDDFREVEAIVKGEPRNYLIASQKYDDGKAAFAVGVDVTERQQALKALQRAEEKYRMIFENAVEGIFQTTPEGRYLSANPALARIYGYNSPEDLVNQLTNVEADLYVDPKQRQVFVEALTRDGKIVGFEAQIRRRDRAIRWISENARAVYDDDGTILYYEGTVEDITDRKQAEMTLLELNEELESRVQQRTAELQQLNMQLIMEIGQRERIESALRTSEAELRALFAAMTDIITVFNHEGRYEKIVSTNSELLYTPEEELLGRSIQEILPSEQAALFLEHIQRALEEDQIINLEYSLPVNGEDVWFAATISPLPDRCVMWVARNITERRKVLDALSKAEAKYRSIFENAAEGIFQTTTDGRYISANPALVRMYGYDSFAEMAARIQNIDEQVYVEQGLRQQFREQLERNGVMTGFKAQVRRKDGSLIWTSENARLVCDHEGQPLYYEGTVADITKQKAAEDALQLEQQRSEALLLNVLPKAIAERLKREERAIAERYDQVTILFADIVDFTSLSAQISPTELVEQLNDIFSAFDQLAEWYNLEKIKTIGDAYMVAGGITATTANHAPAMADMALDMQLAMTQFRQSDGQPYRLRMGIHTGPAVGGVIGIKKFIYDLWGDTVNVASRMEAQGIADMIQVTEATYQLIHEQFFLENRGEILVKGRGLMNTYWLRGRRG
ncbi:PAS domain S-box protein [Spirulina sp. CCNP1310]|uniref:PAS domain S-box protein n=1 Tax=Spirulina sp. CCNP1310 TaxID=3110249 RepID=UPI002B1ED236|nr:PAS domain S-box protein [Spirulina sp. CCNP1310]MEA5420192.1 PAS domain S-box protein [Spirulina sp. CCNP1310]